MERLEVPLEGDITLPIIHMVKRALPYKRRLAWRARSVRSTRFIALRKNL